MNQRADVKHVARFVQHACVPAKINGPPTKTECRGNRSHKTKLFNLKQRWADHTLAFDATSEAENSMISFDVFGARNEETMAMRVGSVLSKTFSNQGLPCKISNTTSASMFLRDRRGVW